MKLVVYKARMCDPTDKHYDKLFPAQKEKDVQFVCFSNAVTESRMVDGWEVRPHVFSEPDYRRRARKHKCLPHVLFPDADYSLWLDGVFTLRHSPWALVRDYLPGNEPPDIVTHRHPTRRCAYEEGKVCGRKGKDKRDVIDPQLRRYFREKFPRNFGLAETGAMLRRHTPAVAALNELWWEEITNGSKRDQISFDYCLWKLGMKRREFKGWTKGSPHFFWRSHHGK